MAFDGFFCEALANELQRDIVPCRVEKINCRGASAEFTVYGAKVKKYLFISLAASANFITVRNEAALPNDMPTAFCLLLRKHFQSGKLKSVSAVENERIIKFAFDCPDDLGHISEKVLYAEIMGKYSNLVLVSDGKVLGSLYSGDLVSYKRALMTGLNYELPPKQDKLPFKGLSFEKFDEKCKFCAEKNADRFLLESFFCFSPLSAWEIAYLCTGKSESSVAECTSRKLFDTITKFLEDIKVLNISPSAIYKDGSAVEFFMFPIHRYGENSCTGFSTLCELTSEFFGTKAEKSLLKDRTSDLAKLVSSRLKRIEKKEALQMQELNDCREKDIYRKNGELITSNIYKIKQGDSHCVCHDWDNDTDVEVKLDVRLSPSKNAEKLFKKYRKLKSAEVAIREQLAESNEEKAYLLSVLDTIERCENAEEAELIRDELISSGYLKKSSRVRQRKPCKPIEYTTSGGFSVKVGRNNLMNDALTKSAGKNDIWFHVKHFAGSHVILYTDGMEPSDADYTEAAQLAAKHSSVRSGKNVEVDYTRVRFVHKPAGSKPGFVTYDKYYTAVVEPK